MEKVPQRKEGVDIIRNELETSSRAFLSAIRRYRASTDEDRAKIFEYFEKRADAGSDEGGMIVDGLLNVGLDH